MRSDTQTITIEVSPSDVVDFIARVENLPRWAIGFAKSVRQDVDRWMVQTGEGEIAISVAVGDSGTVDFHMEPAPGVVATAFTRAVANGSGTELVFTHMQHAGVPDTVFEQLVPL